MTVHFICRGNSFRSYIAEAYLRSLGLEGVDTYSSGSVAARYKVFNKDGHQVVLEVLRDQGLIEFAKNDYADQLTQKLVNQADFNIFVNQPALDEAKEFIDLTDNVIVWDVEDFDYKNHPHISREEDIVFTLKTLHKIEALVNEFVAEHALNVSL